VWPVVAGWKTWWASIQQRCGEGVGGWVYKQVRSYKWCTYLCSLTHSGFSSWALNPCGWRWHIPLEPFSTTYPETQHPIPDEWNPQLHYLQTKNLHWCKSSLNQWTRLSYISVTSKPYEIKYQTNQLNRYRTLTCSDSY
jgi:hypothetical protein